MSSREREVKLRIDDPAIADELLRAPDLGEGRRLGAPRGFRDEDRYLDTADYALLRAGYALRVRRRQGRRLAAIKGLSLARGAALHDRLEIEGPIGEGAEDRDLRYWPDPVRRLVRSFAEGEPELVPLVGVQQDRRERAFDGDPAFEGATLSLDRAAVRDLRRDEPADCGGFVELELELGPSGDAAALEALGEELAARDGVRVAAGGKLERALRLAAWCEGIRPEMPMAEACRAIWRRQLTEIVLNEAGVRQGEDIEYVHDMRVATRRARAAHKVYGRFFQKSAVKPYLRGLRRTARRLGEVRDLDVALDELAAHRRSLPEDEAEGFAALDAHWREAWHAARARLLDWLDDPAYADFLASFDDFCRQPGAGVRDTRAAPGEAPTPFQVRHVLPLSILERYTAMRAFEVPLDAGPVPVETLHALRIAGKRLRYALEPVDPLLGEDGGMLVTQLKRLQKHLGTMNDASVARASLLAAREAGVDGEALERYLALQEEIEQQQARSFQEVWQRFVSADNRALLMRAIARL